MIVVTLTDCPYKLRGDLTKWLWEIQTGVYVGHVSARVRDEIWNRIKEYAKKGKASMVFSTNNEQRMDFRVHNTDWEPIDFDGLKLMLHPCPQRIKIKNDLKSGYSVAAQNHMAKKMARNKNSTIKSSPDKYVVLDLETTGLSFINDDIIEIGAILVNENRIVSKFQALLKTEKKLPGTITELTGITEEMLKAEGRDIGEVLGELKAFVCEYPIICHNAKFDRGFLETAYDTCQLSQLKNQWIDTLSMSKRLIRCVPDYKLSTLLEHFGIRPTGAHRSCDDCESTKALFDKLNEIKDT